MESCPLRKDLCPKYWGVYKGVLHVTVYLGFDGDISSSHPSPLPPSTTACPSNGCFWCWLLLTSKKSLDSSWCPLKILILVQMEIVTIAITMHKWQHRGQNHWGNLHRRKNYRRRHSFWDGTFSSCIMMMTMLLLLILWTPKICHNHSWQRNISPILAIRLP